MSSQIQRKSEEEKEEKIVVSGRPGKIECTGRKVRALTFFTLYFHRCIRVTFRNHQPVYKYGLDKERRKGEREREGEKENNIASLLVVVSLSFLRIPGENVK